MTTKRNKPRTAKPVEAAPPAPACQITITAAAPGAPFDFNVNGFSMLDAIAVLGMASDQIKAMVFQRWATEAKEKTDGR